MRIIARLRSLRSQGIAHAPLGLEGACGLCGICVECQKTGWKEHEPHREIVVRLPERGSVCGVFGEDGAVTFLPQYYDILQLPYNNTGH